MSPTGAEKTVDHVISTISQGIGGGVQKVAGGFGDAASFLGRGLGAGAQAIGQSSGDAISWAPWLALGGLVAWTVIENDEPGSKRIRCFYFLFCSP